MSDFKREERYLVVKLKHLSDKERRFAKAYIEAIEHPPLECVVVESDWPNYEDTWRAIERIEADEYESTEAVIDERDKLAQQLEDVEEAIKAAYAAGARGDFEQYGDYAPEKYLAGLAL